MSLSHERAYIHMFLLSSILLCLLTSFSSVNLVNGDSINPGIYSTDSAPHGVPYQQWTARFWQWLFSLPAEQHPRENYTPEKCANGMV
jgi:hypothetical protein